MEEKDYNPFILALQSTAWVHRQNAVSAIEKLGGEVGIKIIIDSLKDENEDVRCQAISSLMRLKAKNAVNPLIRCLSDPSHKVRKEAAFTLGVLDAEEAIPFLVQRLGDENTAVNYAATRALHKIGGVKVIQPMVDVLFDVDDVVKIRLVEALGAIDPETDENRKILMNGLYKALGDENKLVVIWSAFALLKQGAPEPIYIILEEIDNMDNLIRYNAVIALEKLKDRRALDPLKRRLEKEFELRVAQVIRKFIKEMESENW